MYGPIDYVIVGFKGNTFDGSVIDELSKAVKNKIIRVVDLLFIIKDSSGKVLGGEYADQPDELKKNISELEYDTDTSMPLISEKDIAMTGHMMDKDTAAG